jgi:DNA-binding MarR family transcriptional regulator
MKHEFDVENLAGFAIKRAQHAQRTALDNALRDLGITTAQWGTLTWLQRHDELTNADLARVCDCTPQTMNAIVLHLESDGLIERHRHPTHGTVMPARLTDAGRDLLHACFERVNAVEDRMLADLSEVEQRQLVELLNRCTQALQADSETKKETSLAS